MKHIITLATLFLGFQVHAQLMDKVINEKQVARVEKVLSADDMGGRGQFTPGIDKAAAFIAAEFKDAKLKPWDGKNYIQNFALTHTTLQSAKVTINGETIPAELVAVKTNQKELNWTSTSGIQILTVGAKDNLGQVFQQLKTLKSNALVLLDTAWSKRVVRFRNFLADQFTSPYSAVLVATTIKQPTALDMHITSEVEEKKLKNVSGILPGKTKPDEYVVFSGHYDHLGIGKPDAQGDSIFNGANDDASGTTAVILLAKYFSQLKNNDRTLIFVTFTGEESGGYGSQYFSGQYDAAKVIAMFNIEMIGTESKWGDSSAYITGYEKSDFGKILAKSLQGTGFSFNPDPYPTQNLFYRSDNATLARLGVPAHTISTSKMDSEKYYHTQQDEFETLNMANMTEIIRSIALSAKGIISGADTPSRVEEK